MRHVTVKPRMEHSGMFTNEDRVYDVRILDCNKPLRVYDKNNKFYIFEYVQLTKTVRIKENFTEELTIDYDEVIPLPIQESVEEVQNGEEERYISFLKNKIDALELELLTTKQKLQRILEFNQNK